MAETNFNDTVEDLDKVKAKKIQFEFVSQARSIVRLPEPINRIVASVGSLKIAEDTFLPVLPADIYDTANRAVPIPQFVYLTNLRQIVEYLSDPNSVPAFRRAFQVANSIPGTRWRPDDILLNPNDIIIPNYTIDDFTADTMLINPLLNQIETYIPKMKGGSNAILDT